MKTKISFLKKALYVFIPGILIALVVVKLKSNKKMTQQQVYQYDKKEALFVQADTLQLENIKGEYSYSGTFEPNKETKVSAEIQGKINEVLVDVGTVVHKNQALIRLDHSLLNLQVKSIDVQIEGLEADVNRYSILVKADAIQGIQLEKSVLALKSAKVQKANLMEQLNKTIVKAPFGAIVTAKLIEEGAFASPGVPLLQLTDINELKFSVLVPEKDLHQFKIGKSYSISADAYSDDSFSGQATLIGSKANSGSSFPIQFSVKNTADLKIKSGMFGKVRLKEGIKEMGIIISSDAILGTAIQPQVFLIRNGKAISQHIVISKRMGNKSVVSSGLTAGDVIVTNGFVNLFEGANVITK